MTERGEKLELEFGKFVKKIWIMLNFKFTCDNVVLLQCLDCKIFAHISVL